MFEAVEGLLAEHRELESRLADPSIHSDQGLAKRLNQRYAELSAIVRTYDEWQRLGVRTMTGGALPDAAVTAALVAGRTRHFLVYPNYDALLQYNCAHSYALSVALLGDRLASAAAPAPPARSRPPAHH